MNTIFTLALALTLTACGANPLTDDEKAGALSETETASALPDFRGWQIMPEATDSCYRVDASFMSCMVEFTAGDENCGDATFKFIVKSGGYEYVQTLEDVIIRQGEFHQIKFESRPEMFNIEDKLVEEMSHAFRCYGPNGETVRMPGVVIQ